MLRIPIHDVNKVRDNSNKMFAKIARRCRGQQFEGVFNEYLGRIDSVEGVH